MRFSPCTAWLGFMLLLACSFEAHGLRQTYKQDGEMEESAEAQIPVNQTYDIQRASQVYTQRTCIEHRTMRFSELHKVYGDSTKVAKLVTNSLLELVRLRPPRAARGKRGSGSKGVSGAKQGRPKKDYKQHASIVSKKNPLAQTVWDIWHLEDTIENQHLPGWFGTNQNAHLVRELSRQRDAKVSELSNKGLNYKRMGTACEDGGGQQAIDCMTAKAASHDKTRGSGTKAALEQYLDVMEYESEVNVDEDSTLKRILGPFISKLELKLSSSGFLYDEHWKACKKQALSETEQAVQVFMDQMAGPVAKEGGKCSEVGSSYCPEGTEAGGGHGFRFGKALGISLGGHAASTAVVSALALSVIGAAPALLALQAVLSGAGVIGGIVHAGGGGTSDCLCLPIGCYYDGNTQSCEVGPDSGVDRKNPFATALPMIGMKCAQVKPGKCQLQTCAAQDYARRPRSAVGKIMQQFNVYGSVGKKAGQVFNCLSDTGSSTGSLVLRPTLPFNNTPNTARERRALLGALKDGGQQFSEPKKAR